MTISRTVGFITLWIIAAAGAYAVYTNEPQKAVAPTSITCADAVNGFSLKSVALYDGPPADMAELAPDTQGETENRWTLSAPAVSSEGYVLQCTYTDGSATLQAVPYGVTCVGRNDTNLLCR